MVFEAASNPGLHWLQCCLPQVLRLFMGLGQKTNSRQVLTWWPVLGLWLWCFTINIFRYFTETACPERSLKSVVFVCVTNSWMSDTAAKSPWPLGWVLIPTLEGDSTIQSTVKSQVYRNKQNHSGSPETVNKQWDRFWWLLQGDRDFYRAMYIWREPSVFLHWGWFL